MRWPDVPVGLIMIPLSKVKIQATERVPARLGPAGLILATGGALGLVWAVFAACIRRWIRLTGIT
jgi:hypothetical protein